MINCFWRSWQWWSVAAPWASRSRELTRCLVWTLNRFVPLKRIVFWSLKLITPPLFSSFTPVSCAFSKILPSRFWWSESRWGSEELRIRREACQRPDRRKWPLRRICLLRKDCKKRKDLWKLHGFQGPYRPCECLCTIEKFHLKVAEKRNQNQLLWLGFESDFEWPIHSTISSPYARYSYNGGNGFLLLFSKRSTWFEGESAWFSGTILANSHAWHSIIQECL